MVGAYSDDPAGVEDAGTVYAFNATTSALTTTLNNPGPADFDQFGISVAISGNRAMVGAPGKDPDETPAAGNAYTFACAELPVELSGMEID